jgi:hypothetical protein
VAIGDVKYKLAGSEWFRADLYEVVAFAVEFGTPHASIVTFKRPGQNGLADVQIGHVRVTQLTWPAEDGIAPESAAEALADDVQAWLVSTSETVELAA